MDRKLLDYLPPVIGQVREIQLLMETEQGGIEDLWEATENTLKEGFLDSHSTYGASRWEKILNISPKGTDTLEARNYRILAKLNERLPYTVRMLHEQLRGVCGEGNYVVRCNFDQYYLRVSVLVAAKETIPYVEELLERIIPLNLFVDMALRVPAEVNPPVNVKMGCFRHETIKIVAYPEPSAVEVKQNTKFYLASPTLEEVFIHAYPES